MKHQGSLYEMNLLARKVKARVPARVDCRD